MVFCPGGGEQRAYIAVCIPVNSHTATIHGTNVQGGGGQTLENLEMCGNYSCMEGVFTCESYSHVEGH